MGIPLGIDYRNRSSGDGSIAGDILGGASREGCLTGDGATGKIRSNRGLTPGKENKGKQ